MGYLIQLVGENFHVPKEGKQMALQRVRELMNDPEPERRGYNNTVGGETVRYFSWLNNAEPDSWNTFEDAMEAWRFPVETDESGDIVSIDFTGQKIGQENLLFQRIAPFVKNGSWIELRGEDHEVTRLEFHGTVTETGKFYGL